MCKHVPSCRVLMCTADAIEFSAAIFIYLANDSIYLLKKQFITQAAPGRSYLEPDSKI